jgi:MarR family transcriptional regulator for hemolysin
MTHRNMERAVAQKLVQLGRRWRLLGHQALSGLGLSNSTGWCLLHLSRLGADARQSDLARVVEVREATLARTLARLETLGFISRAPNPRDARANLMCLTDHGRSLVEKIEHLLAEMRQDILKDVDTDNLAAILDAFAKMDARFSERWV